MYGRNALLLTIFLALWLAACGTGVGPGGGRRGTNPSTAPASGNGFLYVSDSAADDIFGFRIDNSSGNLTPVAGSPFHAIGSAPGRMAVDRAQRFLFGINTAPATLASYVTDNQAGILVASDSIAVKSDPHSLASLARPSPGHPLGASIHQITSVLVSFLVPWE
jgi:hypothetical protein